MGVTVKLLLDRSAKTTFLRPDKIDKSDEYDTFLNYHFGIMGTSRNTSHYTYSPAYICVLELSFRSYRKFRNQSNSLQPDLKVTG
jgi:hypothetical protein